MRVLFLFAAVLTLTPRVSPAKILFLLPIASKSHVSMFDPFIRELAKRGHEITSFTPVASKSPPQNVREIVAVPVEEILNGTSNRFEQRASGNKFTQLMNVKTGYNLDNCKKVLGSNELKNVMKNEKFDLIVVSILRNFCLLGVIDHFQAPFILFTTIPAPSQALLPLGQRLPPSFVPNPILTYSDAMTFWQRSINLIYDVYLEAITNYKFFPETEKLMSDALGRQVNLFKILSNASMTFSFSHFTLTYPRPYLPSVLEVGGMHITSTTEPLPNNLEAFMNEAEHGCIVFSLGSTTKTQDMPGNIRKMFMDAFGKLKQRVLVKWDGEENEVPDRPKNVKLVKWLPQRAVLGHNKTKLFISHGGVLSTQEAVYYGVPILGIPLVPDQDFNIQQAVRAGFALAVEISRMYPDELDNMLNELLYNQKYTAKAKQLSRTWRDQPMSPLDSAVYWTEYVIRHKGAPQLRSAARELNFWQYHCLDVVAFLLVVVVVSILLSLYAGKLLIQKISQTLFKKSELIIQTKKMA